MIYKIKKLSEARIILSHFTSSYDLEAILESETLKTYASDITEVYFISFTDVSSGIDSQVYKDFGCVELRLNEAAIIAYRPEKFLFKDSYISDYTWEKEYRVYNWISPLYKYVDFIILHSQKCKPFAIKKFNDLKDQYSNLYNFKITD